MMPQNSIAQLFGLASCVALAACNHASEDANGTQIEVVEADVTDVDANKIERPHGKQSASVTFTHDPVKTLAVGESGAVQIEVSEGYASGALVLQAKGDDGLTVYGAQATSRLDMADGQTHNWRIDFQADTDGVHYINILATADMGGALFETRAHTIRVNVGEWEAAQAQAKSARMQPLDNGELAVIMEAEETINPE
ncbi:MAG: hypothetical protein HRT82_15595 [Henriciella sp.]|nr:hypothetical protein [Henriciella sp.]